MLSHKTEQKHGKRCSLRVNNAKRPSMIEVSYTQTPNGEMHGRLNNSCTEEVFCRRKIVVFACFFVPDFSFYITIIKYHTFTLTLFVIEEL